MCLSPLTEPLTNTQEENLVVDYDSELRIYSLSNYLLSAVHNLKKVLGGSALEIHVAVLRPPKRLISKH